MNNKKVEWFESAHVHRAPWVSFGYSTPRHGGLPCDDASAAMQVGPILDRGLLDASIYDLLVHRIWMCNCIYAHLPLNAQRLDKTLLPMFLNKLADFALCEACSVAASYGGALWVRRHESQRPVGH